jgi:tRNA(adenine34) deaminase
MHKPAFHQRPVLFFPSNLPENRLISMNLFSPEDEHYMQMALAQARLAADSGEVPVGAVLVAGGRVITKTHNQTELLCDPTAHAEMLALTSACSHFQSRYLTEATLYVTLEPCPMCASALFWAQVGRVVWAAADEKRGFLRHSPDLLHPVTRRDQGLLAGDAAELLTQFFRERRS